jgi:hypothetical protein
MYSEKRKRNYCFMKEQGIRRKDRAREDTDFTQQSRKQE